MSDTTDDMDFYAGLYEGHLEIMERRKREHRWTMKNGETVLVKKMSTGHILKVRRRLEMKISELERDIQELDGHDPGSVYSYAQLVARIEEWQEWLAIMNKQIKKRMNVLKGKGQF